MANRWHLVQFRPCNIWVSFRKREQIIGYYQENSCKKNLEGYLKDMKFLIRKCPVKELKKKKKGSWLCCCYKSSRKKSLWLLQQPHQKQDNGTCFQSLKENGFSTQNSMLNHALNLLWGYNIYILKHVVLMFSKDLFPSCSFSGSGSRIHSNEMKK